MATAFPAFEVNDRVYYCGDTTDPGTVVEVQPVTLKGRRTPIRYSYRVTFLHGDDLEGGDYFTASQPHKVNR